jgi:hypothetical protein
MHQRSITILAAFALVVGMTSTTQAAWRWIDDNGNVIYSQTRPADREAEYIAPLHGPAGQTAPAATGGAATSAPKPAQAPAATQDSMSRDKLQAAVDARNKDNCQRARVNLQVLSQPGQLRTKNADGQLVPMPENVRQQKIETAKRQIQELCK